MDADKKSKTDVDKQLDQALQDTFPASDAVSVGDATSDKPERPANRRPAEIDKALVDKLADELAARKKGAA